MFEKHSFDFSILVSLLRYNTEVAQGKRGERTMIQSTSYHVDGTAALRPEERSYLRLYEGGAGRGRGASLVPVQVQRAALVVLAVTLTILLALGVSAVDSLREAYATQAIDAAPKEVVSVVNGDSLWSIAEAHPVQGTSTKSVVSWIMAHNDLSAPSLEPGDTLTVPMLQS